MLPLRRAFDGLKWSNMLPGSRALHLKVQLTFPGIDIDHQMVAVKYFAVENLQG